MHIYHGLIFIFLGYAVCAPLNFLINV